MNAVARFEDLEAWRKARQLTKAVYMATRQGAWTRDYALAGQIQRAAVSIMSNIAEGFERSGLGEFHQFLSTAKASCAELRSQLYVALDAGYIDEHMFHELWLQAEEVGRIIGGLSVSVARQRKNRAS